MAFFYHDGELHLGESAGNHGADAHAVKVRDVLPKIWDRPTYVYDLDDIDRRYRALNQALGPVNHTVHYAMKANSSIEILTRLAKLGAGVDTVSGGEIDCAREAGIAPEKIIFSGVAKTVAEITLALEIGIKQINVESPQELVRIAQVASRLGKKANIAFRLNPDVNPQTHPYITTGFRDNKFGMDESFLPELIEILRRYPQQLRARGLTMHIGSLLFDLGVFREAITKTAAVHRRLEKEGFVLDRIDIGGGLGIRYETDDDREEFELIAAYGKMACELFNELFRESKANASANSRPELLVEPGRVLVARAGLLVGEVQYIKSTRSKTFAILDTGMHHLLRPALYQAKHRLLALKNSAATTRYDVVGPICESSDFIAKDVDLPTLAQTDLVGIADAGAYGFAMASHYNSHALPREVFVSNGKQIPDHPKPSMMK